MMIIRRPIKMEGKTDEIIFKEKLNLSSLFDIGTKHHTDKVYNHRYDLLYEKYLSHHRGTAMRLPETGASA